MKKLSFRGTFFKDILFNKIINFKLLFINKIVLFSGLTLNALAFLLYSFTGISFFENIDSFLRMSNAFFVISILTITHRVSVNNLNIAKDVSQLEDDVFLSTNITDIEIVPKNFILYEDMPLKVLKDIYKDGAYVLITTSSNELTFYAEEENIYLVEDDQELAEVKSLKLKQDII